MFYPRQIAQDYQAWQELGQEEFQQHALDGGEVLAEHLGHNIGAYGVFGTMFYDIAHQGVLAPNEDRAEVARQSIWMAGALELMDSTIDEPSSSRDPQIVETFLSNCWGVMLEGDSCAVVPEIALPEQQLACYGVSAVIYGDMTQKGYIDKKDIISGMFTRLNDSAIQQLEATDMADLLDITKNITGICCETAALSSEFVDQTSYPAMKQAAWHFGAMSGVLDHGSELLADIREGSNTFAIAYLQQHGASTASLRAIQTIRKEAAHEQYAAGQALLETPKEKYIYNIAGKILTARYAVKRWQEGVTPRKLEAAMVEAEDEKLKVS